MTATVNADRTTYIWTVSRKRIKAPSGGHVFTVGQANADQLDVRGRFFERNYLRCH